MSKNSVPVYCLTDFKITREINTSNSTVLQLSQSYFTQVGFLHVVYWNNAGIFLMYMHFLLFTEGFARTTVVKINNLI